MPFFPQQSCVSVTRQRNADMVNLVPVLSGLGFGGEPLRASGEGLAIAEFMKSGDNAIATSATKSGRSSAIGRARNALEESA